ncbi:PhoX family protein, partial [Xanthomonas oryzae]
AAQAVRSARRRCTTPALSTASSRPASVQLTSQQIADAGKTIAEDDYRDTEFCGACWDPLARTLFVNIQTPGITLAITGPWERGPL